MLKGAKFTAEHKKKLSEIAILTGRKPPSRKGAIPWNKGMHGVQTSWNIGIPMRKEARKKLSLSILNLYKNKPEIIEKIRNANKIKWQDPEYRNKCEEAQKGEKSYRWEGGKSMLPYGPEFTRDRKSFVRARDSFTCQGCGLHENKIRDGENLSIHHIDYDKNNCSTENLITTCRSCNSKANFEKAKWIKFYKNKLQLQRLNEKTPC